MAYELVYTSVPHGIKIGSSGFCIVAYTNGLGANLALQLEGLSSYKPVFPHYDENATKNPVAYSHYICNSMGNTLHILSRICFYGVDYSHRSNKLAHHIVATESECKPHTCGPAEISGVKDFFRCTWQDKPQLFPKQLHLPTTTSAQENCKAHWWETYTGDAGWAGVLAQHFLDKCTRPVFIVFDPLKHDHLIELVQEALQLLPANKRWEVTYNTYLTMMPADMSCHWRFCTAESNILRDAKRNPDTMILDLSAMPDRASDGPLQEAARTGIPPAAQSEPTDSPVTAAPSAKSIQPAKTTTTTCRQTPRRRTTRRSSLLHWWIGSILVALLAILLLRPLFTESSTQAISVNEVNQNLEAAQKIFETQTIPKKSLEEIEKSTPPDVVEAEPPPQIPQEKPLAIPAEDPKPPVENVAEQTSVPPKDLVTEPPKPAAQTPPPVKPNIDEQQLIKNRSNLWHNIAFRTLNTRNNGTFSQLLCHTDEKVVEIEISSESETKILTGNAEGVFLYEKRLSTGNMETLARYQCTTSADGILTISNLLKESNYRITKLILNDAKHTNIWGKFNAEYCQWDEECPPPDDTIIGLQTNNTKIISGISYAHDSILAEVLCWVRQNIDKPELYLDTASTSLASNMTKDYATNEKRYLQFSCKLPESATIPDTLIAKFDMVQKEQAEHCDKIKKFCEAREKEVTKEIENLHEGDKKEQKSTKKTKKEKEKEKDAAKADRKKKIQKLNAYQKSLNACQNSLKELEKKCTLPSAEGVLKSASNLLSRIENKEKKKDFEELIGKLNAAITKEKELAAEKNKRGNECKNIKASLGESLWLCHKDSVRTYRLMPLKIKQGKNPSKK